MPKIILSFLIIASASFANACPIGAAYHEPEMKVALAGLASKGYECEEVELNLHPVHQLRERIIELDCRKVSENRTSFVKLVADHVVHSTLLCQLTVSISENSGPN